MTERRGRLLEPEVLVRRRPNEAATTVALRVLRAADVVGAQPVRTVRSVRGMRHYAGRYWAATTSSHVVFESRLELARLLLADFDSETIDIIGQPFQIVATVDRRIRRHVPDYFLLRRDGSVCVVNVKPASRTVLPDVAAALEWPRTLLTDHGWDYEIWTGTDAIRLANIRFLAAYRRPEICPDVAEVMQNTFSGDTLKDVEIRLRGWVIPDEVRSVLLQALWNQHLTCDLSRPLGTQTVVKVER